MQKTIEPAAALRGELNIPASKSHGQRLYAGALLCRGRTVLHRVGDSDDERAALSIIEQAGVRVERLGDRLLLDSPGLQARDMDIHCGESGLAARLFTPLLAAGGGRLRINGRGSLLRRPMQPFDRIFAELGGRFRSDRGHLPFEVWGGIDIPERLRVDGSLSSQFVTGLLFALSAARPEHRPPYLDIERPNSLPYILLSIRVLQDFGVEVEMDGGQSVHWAAGPRHWLPRELSVEGDWSSASFLLVGAALKGELRLRGLQPDSLQADRRILEALTDYGAPWHWEPDGALWLGRGGARPFVFDARDSPDLFPPLAVLAAFGQGTSVIRGVHRLAAKESDRAAALCTELGKMGIALRIQDDALYVQGAPSCRAASVDAHNDHRIAMALALAALHAEAPSRLEGAESVSKSYPAFWQDLETLRSGGE